MERDEGREQRKGKKDKKGEEKEKGERRREGGMHGGGSPSLGSRNQAPEDHTGMSPDVTSRRSPVSLSLLSLLPLFLSFPLCLFLSLSQGCSGTSSPGRGRRDETHKQTERRLAEGEETAGREELSHPLGRQSLRLSVYSRVPGCLFYVAVSLFRMVQLPLHLSPLFCLCPRLSLSSPTHCLSPSPPLSVRLSHYVF